MAVKVGLIYQTAVYLPMHNFCGLNGVEQAVVPLVGAGESLIGGVDLTVLVKRRGKR